MLIRIIKPSGFLADYVEYYWILETDMTDGNVKERVIPTGNVQLMFHYRNPFICTAPDNTEKKQSQSFLSGIGSTFADVSTQGISGLVAVTFKPLGASHFFKFPLNEAEEKDLNLFDLIGIEANEIELKLYEAQSVNERIIIVETFLHKRFSAIRQNDIVLVFKAVQLINLHHGQLQAASLSKTLASTPKSLERKFSALIGKTPKQYSRIIRFQSIIKSANNNRKINLTQLALDNGYYDQAHFNKEFKSFSGYTPQEYFKLYSGRIENNFA